MSQEPSGFGRVLAAPRAEMVAAAKSSPSPPLADSANFNGRVPTPDNELAPGWGLLGNAGSQLSPKGVLALQRGAIALEDTFDLSQILFFTFTLPGRAARACVALAEWSGYIMNRVMVRARRHFSIDKQLYYLSWWEPHKSGVLHFHGCIVRPAAMSEERVRELLQSCWYDILCGVSEKAGVDMFERATGGSWRDRWDEVTKSGKRIRDVACDVSTVTKSVSRYMGTYMKKEARRSLMFPPARWWNQTRAVKSLIKQHTPQETYNSLPQEVVDMMLVVAGDLLSADDSAWCVPWLNPFTGETIGWIARYPKEIADKLFTALRDTFQSMARTAQNLAAQATQAARRAQNATIKQNREIEDEEIAWDAVARARYGGRGWYQDERGNWRDGNAKAKWRAARGEYIDSLMEMIGEPIPINL